MTTSCPPPDADRARILEQDNAALIERESAARAEIARLRAVLDSLPDAIYIKDRDGRFLMANAATQDLYGMSPQDLVGMLQHDTHMSAEQCERVRKSDLKIIAGEPQHLTPAYPFWRKDGEMRRIDMTKLRLEDPVTQRSVVLLIAKDVTDTLGERISGDQQTRLSALGQTVARVAHDLRTPLGTLFTSVTLLKRIIDMQVPRAKDVVERIERALQRCDAIVSDLLDFTRENALSRQDTDVDAWLALLLDDASINFPIVLDTALTLNGLRARIDRDRMDRAISNVLGNACEALYASTRGRRGERCNLLVSTQIEHEHVLIAVEDDGPGIPEPVQEQVTRALFTTKPLGIGLGLAIAEDTMQRHGGGLSIASEPGKGTRVTLWFPSVDSE